MPVLRNKPERVAERKVCQWADAHGILHNKLNLWGARGMPDRVFWLPGGCPLLMEFKRLDEDLRKLQQARMRRLLKLGYEVETCYSAPLGIAALRQRMELHKLVDVEQMVKQIESEIKRCF